MDLHLTIPLWPLAAFLSLVVGGLVGSFVVALEPAHPREENRPGFATWMFWLASLALIGGCVWVIWQICGYPVAANVITTIYAGVIALGWLSGAIRAVRRRFHHA